MENGLKIQMEFKHEIQNSILKFEIQRISSRISCHLDFVSIPNRFESRVDQFLGKDK